VTALVWLESVGHHQRQALYTKANKDGASSPNGETIKKEAS
jgi:hypothetical protein